VVLAADVLAAAVAIHGTTGEDSAGELSFTAKMLSAVRRPPAE
jgi:hypothetical protein